MNNNFFNRNWNKFKNLSWVTKVRRFFDLEYHINNFLKKRLPPGFDLEVFEKEFQKNLKNGPWGGNLPKINMNETNRNRKINNKK